MADFKMDEKDGLLITWKDDGGKDQAAAFNKMYAALQRSEPVRHSTSASDIYKDIYSGNVSVRDEFNIGDYEAYRPSERLPGNPKSRIRMAMQVYYDVGIVRNIIDLMGDFTVQGIDIVHPKKRVESWFKKWWKIVKGKERSERLANYLARTCNVIIKRETGKITLGQSREFYKTIGGPKDPIVPHEEIAKLEKREIPCRYHFLNPLSLDIIGDELNSFIDPANLQFGLTLNPTLSQKIGNPSTKQEKELVSKLPADIVNAVRKGNKVIPLASENIRAVYYKKDDWDQWAVPITYSILPNIITLKKMQLVDRSALDGAISQIRLWKLGNLEAKILPSAAAIDKLANMLVNGVGGGIIDLIWGPDIELTESTTTLHNFLGDTKYVPVLNAIYAGLGIPPLFTGANSQGSFTNNFLAIKTLIERLQYIRERVIEFWEGEILLVQKAMGFEDAARITFDRMTLNDEASILQLITGLVDRDIISNEYAQEMVGAVPEIENFRIKREGKERTSGKRPTKASPYHSPMVKEDIKKLFVQGGTITPSEAGIELDEKKTGEFTSLDKQAETQIKVAKFKPVGISGQGRPKNKKDSKKRKQKEVKPRRSVSYLKSMVWAEEAQNAISDHFTPIYLKSLAKKNLRQISDEEFKNFENFKFAVLSSLKPYQPLDSKILNKIVNKKIDVPLLYSTLLAKCIETYEKENKKEISIENKRKFQSQIYALYNIEDLDEKADNNDDCLQTLS